MLKTCEPPEVFHQVIFQAAFCSFRLTKGSFIFKSSLAAHHLFPGTFLRPVLFLVAVPVNQAIECCFRKYMNQNKKKTQRLHGSSHFPFRLTALLLKPLFLPQKCLTKGSDIRLSTGDGHCPCDRRKNERGRLWPPALTPCSASGEIWERRGARSNNCRPVSSPGDQRKTPRAPRAGSLCRSLCKCAYSVPAVGGGPNMCVCVLQEEKQHDAAVTF